MNLSTPFISRPIATTLLAIGIAFAGILGFRFMPISPLPQIDFPTITVQATLPGASPETMATAVATPLERQIGQIAGVTELTSTSSLGQMRITVQFDLSRDINGAARDIQSAINASLSQLPSDLPSLPTYRKVNPADAPIILIALTSKVYNRGEMYNVGSTILAQKLSQIEGVGQVFVGGSSLPAIRVELNPMALNNYGISLEEVRGMLRSVNVNRPKGQLHDDLQTSELQTNDQLFHAYQYRPLVVAYRNGAPVLLRDVAEVKAGVEDVRNSGLMDAGEPAVVLVVFKQPGANIIETVDRIKQSMDQFRAAIPEAIKLTITNDRTTTIRASLKDVEFTLMLAMVLVICVMYVSLGNVRAAFIPSIAVPLSLLGTFGVMYLLNYSLDNLSLMALTITTGFVVDDAVVVLENIERHVEAGMKPMQAAIQGAKEVGFTVVSMSASLIAVFIPILLMGGIVGRLFREFAMTLAISIVISLIVSLTVTPMLSSRMLKPTIKSKDHARVGLMDWMKKHYHRSLSWSLRHQPLMLMITGACIALSIFLFYTVPKGFFPIQDTGRLIATLQAQQDMSFQTLEKKFAQFIKIVSEDPAVFHVNGFVGGTASIGRSGSMYISLKPLDERKVSSEQVMDRLRAKFAKVIGVAVYLQSAQDLVIGGRQSSALYQYTILSYDLKTLNLWAPQVMDRISKIPGIVDLNSDQMSKGLQVFVNTNRDTAARFGISQLEIDNILYDAFGQRQVSTMYTAMNQYHVVMEVAPQYWQRPDMLHNIYMPSSSGKQVPLSTFASFSPSSTLLLVNHQGQFPSATLAFNLAPGYSLGGVVENIKQTVYDMNLPEGTIRGAFSGTAQAFQSSLASEPYLILAALLVVYIVLGILYESIVHPITILSTLPSAGVGALLSLLITGTDLTIISLIGMILLIGIVKKNAIMMIDFAIDIKRYKNKSSIAAIYQACLLRFRPIMMTTMAALLSALPLALGHGVGSELRRPLGIAIVGGLIMSQLLTLYTTPVIYLSLEKLNVWIKQHWAQINQPPRGRMTTASSILFLLLLTGCTVGPDYDRPPVDTPTDYKEPAPGWKYAEPKDEMPNGEWWKIYKDPELDCLINKLNSNNQNIIAIEANFQQAAALVAQAEAAYAPVVTASGTINRQKLASNSVVQQQNGSITTGSSGVTPSASTPTSSKPFNQYNLTFNATWEPDIWGSVRRTVEASEASAQSTAALLAATRLAAQGSLAQFYFQLRGLDEDQKVLDDAVTAYEKLLEYTKKRFAAGVGSEVDILQAQTQMETAQVQAIDNGILRGQYEHAIAVLIGTPPSCFEIKPRAYVLIPPQPTLQLPCALLERRPDVAQAERLMAQANAQVGVAVAAFFPSLTFNADGGNNSRFFEKLFSAPAQFWSIGGTLAETLFDGGYRMATLDAARWGYDQSVAQYRQTVLAAFQDVEDNLISLRILASEYQKQDQLVSDLKRTLKLIMAQYQAGTVDISRVLDAEINLYSTLKNANDIGARRMVSSVGLIKALGGGWDSDCIKHIFD
jgi:multidrug efflux pump